MKPEDQLGPLFKVREAALPLAGGWVVTHRRTGLFVWTGGVMSLTDAAAALLRRVHR